MGMRVDIVTLFPEMCQQVLDSSIIGRAAKKGYIETHCHQIRDFHPVGKESLKGTGTEIFQ